MKKFKENILLPLLIGILIPFIILSVTFRTENIELKKEIKAIKSEKEQIKNTKQWDIFLSALIWQESEGNNFAINDDAIGVLQITPIYVKEVNKIIGYEKYKFEDRFSRAKSIEMFQVIQNFYNPEKSIITAIKLHNPKANKNYTNSILSKYNLLNKININNNE